MCDRIRRRAYAYPCVVDSVPRQTGGVMRRDKGFRRRLYLGLLWFPVSWLLLTHGQLSWSLRLIVAASLYLGLLAFIVVVAAVRLRLSGAPVRGLFRREIWVAPRRTSNIPAPVEEYLPKLVWVARNREPARLRPLLIDGPLLTRDNIRYTAVLATSLAASLVERVAQSSADGDKAIEDLLTEALDIAPLLPVEPGSEALSAWLTQFRGGEMTYRFPGWVGFELSHLCALIALGAGAATKTALGRQEIFDQYHDVADAFTHGHRMPQRGDPRRAG